MYFFLIPCNHLTPIPMYICIMLIHRLILISHVMLMLFSEWDADFATEAYRQQVEVLAQHQVKIN